MAGAKVSSAMTLLEIQGVSKSFGAVDVLRSVDLEIGAGDVIGLVGDRGNLPLLFCFGFLLVNSVRINKLE